MASFRGVDGHRPDGHPGCVSRAEVAAGATYQSAERILALLTSFDDTRVELSVTEMAASLGVHKSTASRLAGVLERAGLLTRSGRRFRLGLEVIRLGTLAMRSTDFVAWMQPAMERLSQPHAVADGKVLMAYGALGVPEHLERYTANTITDHDALNAELEAVRRNGYATAVAELEEGLVAAASPVFGGTGACIAALSVNGPAFRMQPESLDKLGRLCAEA
jgi:IclR family transcriptional regulator, acetate operon repressor